MGIAKITAGFEFQRVYNTGKKQVGRTLIVYYLPDDTLKYAVVASYRSVGNAVKRNRAKRLLREAFRQIVKEQKLNGLYILVARSAIVGEKTPTVVADLKICLQKLLSA